MVISPAPDDIPPNLNPINTNLVSLHDYISSNHLHRKKTLLSTQCSKHRPHNAPHTAPPNVPTLTKGRNSWNRYSNRRVERRFHNVARFDVEGAHTALPFILGRYSSCSVWKIGGGEGILRFPDCCWAGRGKLKKREVEEEGVKNLLDGLRKK